MQTFVPSCTEFELNKFSVLMCKTYSIASVKSIRLSMTRKCHNKNNLQISLRRREGETQNTLNGHMIPEGSSSETNKLLFSSEMITKLETVLRYAQRSNIQTTA